MDISSLVGTLMNGDSLQNIGKAAGAGQAPVKNVLTAAIPALLSGAKAQSADASTGFAAALLSHGKDDTSDLSSFLGKVDLKDGGKIISHLLGGKEKADTQIAEIADQANVSKKDTKNILSAAAPLFMSLLGKQASTEAKEDNTAAIGNVTALFLKNADVGSLLTGLLGAQTGTNEKKKDDKKDEKKDDKKNDTSALGAIGGILGNLLK